VKAKEELGIDFDIVEPTAISEYEGFQRDFARTGEYDIVICVGFDQMDALNITAREYPNQTFALIDEVVNTANVASLLFRMNEASGRCRMGESQRNSTHTRVRRGLGRSNDREGKCSGADRSGC